MRYPQSRIDVVADVPESTRIRAHPELLSQLLENLVDNAVKYGPSGSPVDVRVVARDGGIELAVEDAGPGIAAADLPHVFEPFFRSASARDAGVRGVGLGLAIARRIAESMGARLTAENRAGAGSRFRRVVPMNFVGRLDAASARTSTSAVPPLSNSSLSLEPVRPVTGNALSLVCSPALM